MMRLRLVTLARDEAVFRCTCHLLTLSLASHAGQNLSLCFCRVIEVAGFDHGNFASISTLIKPVLFSPLLSLFL